MVKKITKAEMAHLEKVRRQEKKLLKKVWSAWRGVRKARVKAAKRLKREQRNRAFKRNMRRFNLEKARRIAVYITKKQKGLWRCIAPPRPVVSYVEVESVGDSTRAETDN